MDDDNRKQSGQFDASLHLPGDSAESERSNAAADLIRKKVEAAYTHEPDAKKEENEAEDTPKSKRSKHQQFIYELTNSGRPLHEVQTAWHEYYAGLTDAEKHQVWQEFYSAHAQAAHHPAVTHAEPMPEPPRRHPRRAPSKIIRQTTKKSPQASRSHIPEKRHTRRKANPLHSLFFGLGVGSLVIIIFLFSFFNERIIAPFIQPSRSSANIPIITSGTVSEAPEVIIPKINVEAPVVYDVNTINEAAVEQGLNNGVVHYADTALPGQDGNVIIFGHSSGNIFNQGNYKFVFSLLRALNNGDTFYLQKDGKRYVYQVYKKEIVKPTDVSVLGLADKPATATLITCDPPGLSTNRLVVIGEQISPDPSKNAPLQSHNLKAQQASIIPSQSQTLWSRLTKWFTE